MTQAVARLIRDEERDALLALYAHLHEHDPVLEDSEELRLHWNAMLQDESLNIIVVEDAYDEPIG